MLEGMTNLEITGWVSRLDEIDALLAPTDQRGDDVTTETLQRARAALADLHAQMLRAEVRAVIGGRAADGRHG